MQVIANKFAGAIHNHLWRVHGLQAEAVSVRILSVGDGTQRIWIPPSKSIPIVHVLAEDYNLRSQDRLISIKLLQKRIRRRTTGAPLRGKQFNQHRYTRF